MFNHHYEDDDLEDNARDTVVILKKSETADLMDYTDSGIPGLFDKFLKETRSKGYKCRDCSQDILETQIRQQWIISWRWHLGLSSF